MSSLQQIAFQIREARDSYFHISKSVTANVFVRDHLQKFSAIKIEKYHAFMKPELPAYERSPIMYPEINVEN